MVSNVVVFASVFLGIVSGPQMLEVVVSDGVAAVRILVDEALVAEISEAPWRVEHDFGPELTTHRLTAIALDGAGEEIGRVSQQLNLPRPPIEVEILLEDWNGKIPKAARVIWNSSEALEPERASVTLDGAALDPSRLDRIELPALDPEAVHMMAAEIVFPNRKIGSTEVLFGGGYGSAVEAGLTAVALVVGKHRARSAGGARGWLRRSDGTELPVVALEDAPAEVAIVRDPADLARLAILDFRMRATRKIGHKRLRLGRRDRIRFVGSRYQAHGRYRNFPVSQTFGAQDGTIPELLASVRLPDSGQGSPRLTDAVAVASRLVVASQRRRAVLLVTANCARVSGRYGAEAVRSYLAELHVPLHVWQLGQVSDADRARGFCQDAEEVTTPRQYAVASSRLRAELDGQQIVWVRGRLMPGEITVTDAARAVRFAGRR